MEELKVFSTIALMSLLFVPVLNADTVGQWLFDEGSGNVVHDSSRHGNDGTFVGKPEWIKDTPWGEGFALKFGEGAWIEIPDAPSLNVTLAISVEAWIKIFPGNNGEYIYKGEKPLAREDQEGAFSLAFISGGANLAMDLHTGGKWHWTDAGPFPGDGKWHHTALAWDGKTNIVYIDGKEVFRTSIKGPLDKTKEPLYIGSPPIEGGKVPKLIIDEVRISDAALSADKLGFNEPLKPAAVSSLDKLAQTWGAIKQR